MRLKVIRPPAPAAPVRPATEHAMPPAALPAADAAHARLFAAQPVRNGRGNKRNQFQWRLEVGNGAAAFSRCPPDVV